MKKFHISLMIMLRIIIFSFNEIFNGEILFFNNDSTIKQFIKFIKFKSFDNIFNEDKK